MRVLIVIDMSHDTDLRVLILIGRCEALKVFVIGKL